MTRCAESSTFIYTTGRYSANSKGENPPWYMIFICLTNVVFPDSPEPRQRGKLPCAINVKDYNDAPSSRILHFCFTDCLQSSSGCLSNVTNFSRGCWSNVEMQLPIVADGTGGYWNIWARRPFDLWGQLMMVPCPLACLPFLALPQIHDSRTTVAIKWQF